MATRTLAGTLGNLALALLNATLILIAVCLFLGWQLAREIDDISDGFAQSLIDINPVRDALRDLTFEVAALRSDLTGVAEVSGEVSNPAAELALTRLEDLEGRIDTLSGKVNALLDEPEALIDYAVETAADEVKSGIADLRGCTLPEA